MTNANYKQLDNFELTGTTEAKFACEISEDNRIFIPTHTGNYVVHLKADLKSHLSKFSCRKVFFNCSKFYICENVDIDLHSFISSLPKELLYESIARVELSANYTKAPPNLEVLNAQWSERNMIDSSFCMLAVITNLYFLEIYAFSVDETDIAEYVPILNLTETFINLIRKDFVYCERFPYTEKYYELLRRIEYVGATAFCWGHTFSIDNRLYALLITGHFHGFITVWKIFSMNSIESKTECELLGRFSTKLKQISALYWHQSNTYEGGLCMGDIDGHLSVVQISDLNKSNCTVENELSLYEENDLRVEKIFITSIDDYTSIGAVKQTNLLFYFLNPMGDVIDSILHCEKNLQNIVGITVRDNIIKILTENGELFQLTLLAPQNGQLFQLNEEQIDNKLDMPRVTARGMFESKNQVLLGIVTQPARLSSAPRGKHCIKFHLFSNLSLNAVQILMNNKSKSFRDYWDCLECIRLNCLKNQAFPWEGMDNNAIDYDSLSLYELKLQRHLAQISETVFHVVKEIKHYDIKPFIYIHYLVEIEFIIRRLNRLFRKIDNGENLSDFVMRTIDLQVFYLKELVVKDILAKANVGFNFVEKVTRILSRANEISFPDMIQCKQCGEKIIGAICFPPHADSRCSLTLYPMFMSPGYKCLMCQSLAHSNAQLTETEPNQRGLICPYCDIPMHRINISPSVQKILDTSDYTECGEVKSICYSDCLYSNDNSNEMEEEGDFGVDDALVMISDDENDSNTQSEDEQLRQAYLECCNMLSECKVNC